MKTVFVAPTTLSVGDRVLTHGALVEVVAIHRSPCKYGREVAACTSRRIGDDPGAIPRGWFDTWEGMRDRGVDMAGIPQDLEARYWNVQGNDNARFAKVIES